MEDLPRIHWLASYPKSGNTWVRALLYAYQYGNVTLGQMSGHVMSDQNPSAWFASSPIPWGCLNNDQKILLRYPALMYMAMQTTFADGVHIMKTHCANLKVNSIETVPEELTGSSVYLIRDPRDITISYAHHMGLTIDDAIEKMGSVGCTLNFNELGIYQPTSDWSTNVKSWVEWGHFSRITVRYEDMITDTAKELTRILEQYYPDKDVDKARVERAVKLCSFKKLKGDEEANGFNEATKNGKFFRNGKSTWQETLTEEQVKKIESDHGEWMVKLGYELTMEKAA